MSKALKSTSAAIQRARCFGLSWRTCLRASLLTSLLAAKMGDPAKCSHYAVELFDCNGNSQGFHCGRCLTWVDMKFNATITLHDKPIALSTKQLEICKTWARDYLKDELQLAHDAIRLVLTEAISIRAKGELIRALTALAGTQAKPAS